ncbi:hypothetical protein BDR05DRAFT_952888 [Suillus weaverae]|nr:hypothetical protein BDR05DRAFT_952888 [Suillus weaverae]
MQQNVKVQPESHFVMIYPHDPTKTPPASSIAPGMKEFGLNADVKAKFVFWQLSLQFRFILLVMSDAGPGSIGVGDAATIGKVKLYKLRYMRWGTLIVVFEEQHVMKRVTISHLARVFPVTEKASLRANEPKQVLTNQDEYEHIHHMTLAKLLPSRSLACHHDTSNTSSGPPAGATGKDTSTYNQPGDTNHLSDAEIARLASLISKKNRFVDVDNSAAVTAENLLRSERNVAKAQLRANLNYIEEPSDDEEFLDESPPKPSTPFAQTAIGCRMMKVAAFLSSLSPTTWKLMAMASNDVAGEVVMKTVATELLSSETKAEAKVFMSDNTIIATETDILFEIPCPLLNLAKAKVHVPLTLLMNTSLRRIHEDPSCVKLKKGLVLEDPKLCIMDTSNGFPPEATLTADVFFEATSNFLKLLTLITNNVTVQ